MALITGSPPGTPWVTVSTLTVPLAESTVSAAIWLMSVLARSPMNSTWTRVELIWVTSTLPGPMLSSSSRAVVMLASIVPAEVL